MLDWNETQQFTISQPLLYYGLDGVYMKTPLSITTLSHSLSGYLCSFSLCKFPPPTNGILASQQRQETGKLSPVWLFFFVLSSSCPLSQYFKYVFPDGVDTVIVKVSSDMNFPCSVMSIQDIQVQLFPIKADIPEVGSACSNTLMTEEGIA